MIGRINKNISVGKAMAATLGHGIADTFARIAGFGVSQRSNMALWQMRPQRDARTVWANRSKYTGDKLREIRKRKGVGRPPVIGFWMNQTPYPALTCAFHGLPSPNMAEWQRKQRRGESDKDYRARVQ